MPSLTLAMATLAQHWTFLQLQSLLCQQLVLPQVHTQHLCCMCTSKHGAVTPPSVSMACSTVHLTHQATCVHAASHHHVISQIAYLISISTFICRQAAFIKTSWAFSQDFHTPAPVRHTSHKCSIYSKYNCSAAGSSQHCKAAQALCTRANGICCAHDCS